MNFQLQIEKIAISDFLLQMKEAIFKAHEKKKILTSGSFFSQIKQ